VWALRRSPSLVGLLYLPAPSDPVLAPRPRTPPTPLARFEPALLARGEASHHGRALRLEPPIAWRPAEPDPGLTALHAGEEALALFRLARIYEKPEAAELARRLVADWIEQNPIASAPGWDGPILARRIACWSAALGEHAAEVPKDEQLRWRQSIFLQARYLAANLAATEPLGGVRALLGAASVLAGTEPRRWFATATTLLVPAVERLVLADGGHASRNPALHLQALADLVDIAELLPPETAATALVRVRAAAMIRFARALSHPDGGPAGFAGSHRTRAPELADIAGELEERRPPPPASIAFPDSRFAVFHDTARGDACLADWLGPDDRAPLPGAAGSFELALGGERLVVTPILTSPTARGRAHNAVVADGRAFRAGGDHGARFEGGSWGEGPGFGYLGLSLRHGDLRHQRRLIVLQSRAIAVVDHIDGATTSVESLIQLDSGVRIRDVGHRRLYLEKQGVTVTFAWMRGAELARAEGVVLGHRGEPQPATALRLRAPGGGPRELAYLIAEGRRSDAGIDLLDGGEERIAIRFDPRRYLFRWDPAEPPRVLLAD
jgi:hypothetical protein